MKKLIVLAIIFLIMLISLQRVKASDVVFNIIVPVPTYECWIVGNYVGWNLNDAKKCNPIDQSHYQIILNDSTWNDSVTIFNLKYQYLNEACDWAYVERGKDGNYVKARTYKVGINDTIANWPSNFYEAYITFNVTTPKGTEYCFIYGNLFDQEVSVGSIELSKTLVNSDSTVAFSTGLWTHSMCPQMSFRFSSGPTLDYDQLIPSESFNSSDQYPIVTAWKATYTAVPQVPVSKIKIYSNASDIIIEGTETNDMVNIYGVTGLKIMTFESVGERIVVAVPKNEIYFVTTPGKSVKIVVK